MNNKYTISYIEERWDDLYEDCAHLHIDCPICGILMRGTDTFGLTYDGKIEGRTIKCECGASLRIISIDIDDYTMNVVEVDE